MKNSGKYKDKLNIVGTTLRNIRNSKKMSLETLSNKLLLLDVNIPITSLHRIENNQRTVRDYELCAIAKVLNVNINDLIKDFMKNLED